ncbi:hypothetical protein DLAC_04240 [Tieghemostelium lacteum]|uniref:Pre-mRNA-splicing factor SYF2 n=1 Tax=Tieghemostelium lacteum TaxID=361077 RepID=A0A151ZSL0_TIELA|nr:hypothetical protein DLAC_04240 [Tieghemostelium lacteum]|eukprot:KYQ96920.1 hypothetical protein DLAC_04240 [Tieghemostelium lacteum]
MSNLEEENEHLNIASKESLKEEIESFEGQTKKIKYTPTESYNNETFDYTEENKKALLKGPKKVKDSHDFVDPLEKLTPQQRKLHELRQKLNKTKQDIFTTVVNEHKKITQGDNPLDSMDEKRKLYQEKIQKEQEELKSKGLDPTQEALKNSTIEEIEKQESMKKKKKNGKKVNKQIQTKEEGIYNNYKKRVRDLESFQQSEQFKPVVSDVSTEANQYNYGETVHIPSQNISAMKQELLKKSIIISKKKGINPDEDVNYVNETNRLFNQKLSKHYDKYTVEIKQNLERGTAL